MVRNYLKAFRWSELQKMWKEQNQISWLIVYMGMIPIYSRLGMGFANVSLDKTESLIIYLALVLPVILILISAAIHSIRLSKNMYLCPMTIQDRKNMVYHGYYFRIGLHMMIAIAGLIGYILLGNNDVLLVLEYLANSFVLSILSPASNSLEKEGTNRDNKRADWNNWQIIFLIPATLICHCVLAGTILDGKDLLAVKIGVFLALLLIEFPLALSYRKVITCELEAALYFEGSSKKEKT